MLILRTVGIALMVAAVACAGGSTPNIDATVDAKVQATSEAAQAIDATVEARVNQEVAGQLTPPEPTATREPTSIPVPSPTATSIPTRAPRPTATRRPKPAPTPTQSVSQIVDRLRDAVVRIESPTGMGSGTIIDSLGNILTNYHVVDGYNTVTVHLEDRYTRSARVVGYDEELDLAVVKIENSRWPFLPISATRPSVGTEILTLGYALDFAGQSTLTSGVISALRPENRLTWIQTDAALNPGNSGGAAFTLDGRFFGVPTALTSDAENVGWLIGLFSVADVIPQLKDGYKYALPTPTPIPIPTPTPLPSWINYFGSTFSMKYPSEWEITDYSTTTTFSGTAVLAQFWVSEFGTYESLTLDYVVDIWEENVDSVVPGSVRRSYPFLNGLSAVQLSLNYYDSIWDCNNHAIYMAVRIDSQSPIFRLHSEVCEDNVGVAQPIFDAMLNSFKP